MEEADLAPEALPEVRREPVEAGVLGEDERLVLGRDGVQDLDEALELARPALERPAARQDELGVVADLLQLPEHREDGSPPVEPALVLLDPRHPAVDRRAVEARLLDGEPARDLRDRDRRQVELDLGCVLRAPEHERPHERAEPLERVGVASELDRAGERPLEGLAGAEQARVDEIHDRPELSEAVLDRCPREGERTATRDAPERAMSLRPRVLRVLRLVEEQPVPLDLRQRVDVSGRDVVRGHDDVALARGGDEGGADEPARPVMQVHAQPRARSARSRVPTAV